jgi:hypothetical protein
MGMPTETCPSEAELADYVAHAPAASAIEPHLDACPTCRATAARLAELAFASKGGRARTARSMMGAPPAPSTPPASSPSPRLPAGEPAAPLRRGERAGRYQVVDVVGAGAMGTVYAAHDPDLDRTVAIKLLHAELGRGRRAAELRARLALEARALARISHPNVITVYDTGTVGDQVFVAMELVTGGTLRSWLGEAPRSWRDVRDAYVAAGRGLAAAHAAGIVHRDFKPDNVLVGSDGRVRVTDFGLSRADWDDPAPPERLAEGSGEPALPAPRSPPHLTATGALVGTPVYMAPEQLAGGAATALSDLFSFCIALYEALYGERPFGGGSLEELRRSTRGPVRDPPAGKRTPRWIRGVLRRGLRADPGERYPSMTALCDALSREPARVRLWVAALGAVLIVGAAATRALAPAGSGLGARRGDGSGLPDAPTFADASVANSALVAPAHPLAPGPAPPGSGAGPAPVHSVPAVTTASAAPSTTGAAVVPRKRSPGPPPAEQDGIF